MNTFDSIMAIVGPILEIGSAVATAIQNNKKGWKDIRLGDIKGLSKVGTKILKKDEIDYSGILDYHHGKKK